MFDKGLTTNISRFTKFSFVPRHIGSLYSLRKTVEKSVTDSGYDCVRKNQAKILWLLADCLFILTFCLHSLPLTRFHVKIFLYLLRRYSVVHDKQKKFRLRQKKTQLLFVEYFKADFKDLFWEKQSLFIMTFITGNFFQNSFGNTQHPTFMMLAEPTYISGKL